MLEMIEKVLWAVASGAIIVSGVYYSFKLRFVQFHFREMFSNLFRGSSDGISSKDALMMSLAGRIGVGSVAGVALSIYLGGVGSVFWLLLSCFLSAPNTFCETVLGSVYHEKDEGGVYKGGPAYYIRNGLGKKRLGSLYAFLILVSYIGCFLGIQSNTITKSINEIVPVDGWIVGIVVSLLTFLIIFGGVKAIVGATNKIVPVMTLLYLLISLYVIVVNITHIPSIVGLVLKEAFQLKPFFSGFLGSFVIGLQRGIFSNEAGLGTGSMASATSDNSSISQGYVQMIGIYITTLIICGATAIIILTSDYQSLVLNDVNGIEITQYAFQYHLGNVGNWFIFISIVLFSFSTILTGYYYGESSLKYFNGKLNNRWLIGLKLVTIGVLFFGCVMPSTFLWSIVDILVAFLVLINLYALFCLKDVIFSEISCYRRRK